MKELGIGCFGVFLGACLGVVLTLGAITLYNVNGASPAISGSLPSAERADVTVSVSKAYVTTQMQSALAPTGLVKQMSLTLAAPNIIQVGTPVSVPLFGAPMTVNATASASVRVQNGRVSVAVDKVDAGGISVPSNLVTPIVEKMRATGETELNQIIQHNLQGTGLRLSNVRVAPDAIYIDLSAH